MGLSSLQLDAFNEVSKTLHFGRAAKRLHLSQPALSKRIRELEQTLGTPLFIRQGTQVSMTEAGERLRAYCRVREALEEEALADLQGKPGTLHGALRVAGYSTSVRSLLLPTVVEFCRLHPGVSPSLQTRELRELEPLLRSGEVDLALTQRRPARPGLRFERLGEEVSTLVEPRKVRAAQAELPYLDHDADDETTHRYLRLQGSSAEVRRLYFDEIYSILDAVGLGMGRAVAPRHLTRERRDVVEVEGGVPLRDEVYLVWVQSEISSRLQVEARAFLALRIREKLHQWGHSGHAPKG